MEKIQEKLSEDLYDFVSKSTESFEVNSKVDLVLIHKGKLHLFKVNEESGKLDTVEYKKLTESNVIESGVMARRIDGIVKKYYFQKRKSISDIELIFCLRVTRQKIKESIMRVKEKFNLNR